MKNIQRVRVPGALIDTVDMQGALDFVDTKVAAGGAVGHVVAINPEKAYAVQRNRRLREFVEDASLLIPDGIGIVLAARFLYGARIGRVPGADLAQEICHHSAEKGHRLFIYGACEEVNRDATDVLKRRFPGIRVVGRSHGYVPPEKMEELIDRINDSGADILFVALGSPKQEEWMNRYGPTLKVSLCLGVGGTLDTLVGKVKRAPKMFQRLGLEWLYRLLRQPNRIRRQAALPLFAWNVLRQKAQSLRGRHGP